MNIEQIAVCNQKRINKDYYLLEMNAPLCADRAKPGQFVHIRIPQLDGSVLRRPFSIFDARKGIVKIIYKVVGRGTEAMTKLHKGDTLNLIGPLGNGFPRPQADKIPVIVAGGYGAAPLFFFASYYKKKGIAFLGGKTADDIIFPDKFKKMGWKVKVATENGSSGDKGLVTDIFDAWRAGDKAGRCGRIECFVCGPDGLLKAIAIRAQKEGWKAWLSLDKHMGCGVGACLACVQKIRTSDGEETWARVCKDGPVFEAERIIWQ